LRDTIFLLLIITDCKFNVQFGNTGILKASLNQSSTYARKNFLREESGVQQRKHDKDSSWFTKTQFGQPYLCWNKKFCD